DLAVAGAVAARLREDAAIDPAAAGGRAVVLALGKAAEQPGLARARVRLLQVKAVDLLKDFLHVRLALDPAEGTVRQEMRMVIVVIPGQVLERGVLRVGGV